MTHPHSVKLTIDRISLEVQFSCTASEYAPCRLSCVHSCDSYEEGDGCDHELVDGGYCRLTRWFEDSCEGLENYNGDRHELASGPVVLAWNSQGYVEWRYPS